MESKPTYEQAQLHLQVYEMRREARLRQARDWFFQNYYAQNMEEAMRIAAPGTETGAFTMMVFGYWEQACALLNYGLLHEDLFFETSGEFFGVWERVKPLIEEGRRLWANPHFLGNVEKAAQRFEAWNEKRAPGHIATMRKMMEQMRPKAGTATQKAWSAAIATVLESEEAGLCWNCHAGPELARQWSVGPASLRCSRGVNDCQFHPCP